MTDRPKPTLHYPSPRRPDEPRPASWGKSPIAAFVIVILLLFVIIPTLIVAALALFSGMVW